VHQVRAALRHHVDISAQCAAELGLRSGCDDLKLLDRLHAVGNAAQRRRIVVGGQSVDDEVVGQIALACDRQADAWNGGRFREELCARNVRGRRSGHEQRELEKVSSVERQASYLWFRHGRGDLGASRLEHSGFGGYRDGSIDAADAERHGQLERRACVCGERSHRIPKPV
jgi:hypothetical protein